MPPMSKRYLIPLPFLALLLAVGALLLTRGGSSGATAEASAEVTAAFAKIKDLKSFSMRQKVLVSANGEFLVIEQEGTFDLPDKAYVKTSVPGNSKGDNEIVILDVDHVFVKQNNGGWQVVSLQSLGFNPDALRDQSAQQLVPLKLETLGEVKEHGVTLIHYRGRIDGQEYLDLIRSTYLENSAMARALANTTIEKLEVEYYVGKDDQLPYRGSSKFTYVVSGERASAGSEFEYFDFDSPLKLPADLPASR